MDGSYGGVPYLFSCERPKLVHAIRWLGRQLVSRRTAVVVSILASIICLAGFLLYAADKIVAARHEDTATTDATRRASRAIAVGTRTKSDFKGVRYWIPPVLTICPRSDEKWDASLTWGGATRDASSTS
jgi:hypothetical protein